MPVGNLSGLKQVFTEDFSTPAALGSFTKTYASAFSVYADGTPDTAGQHGSPSMYEPSKVLSVANGYLDYYLHSANGKSLGAAVLPILPGKSAGYTGQLYGRYEVRWRTDSLAGFKSAWLLWPDSEVWPRDGEIDFPEGDLNSLIAAHIHKQGASASQHTTDFYPGVAMAGAWHTTTLDWAPNLVTVSLDGKVIGTTSDSIPNTPMHWVLQNESCLEGCPAASTAGHVQVDWLTVYARTS